MTGELNRTAGGVAASVPGTVWAIHALSGAEMHVLGASVLNAGTTPECWGPHVHAHAQFGPRAFHYTPGLDRTLRDLSPDVIDVQGLWMHASLVSLRYHRRSRRPYIVTPHGMLDPWALGFSRWKKRSMSIWFQSEHLRRASCLRATAPLEAQNFRAYGLHQPIAVVPNGVALPAEAKDGPRVSGRRRLLFLSRIHPKKGLAYLIRAWTALAGRHPDWELVVAGPDELGHAAEMRHLAESLSTPRVTWLGAVHGEEKSRLYRSADLFVLPTHAENFGLVVAEALAHGVPVVTTHHAPWNGLVTHGCGWWIPLELDAWVTTLDDAMRLDAAHLMAMGVAGRAWMAQDFAWSAVAHSMLQVYRWVIAGGPPPSCVQPH